MVAVRKLTGSIVLDGIDDSFTRLQDLLDVMDELDAKTSAPTIDRKKVQTSIDNTKKSYSNMLTDIEASFSKLSTLNIKVPSLGKLTNSDAYKSIVDSSKPVVQSLIYIMGILNGSYNKYIDYNKHAAAVTGEFYRNPLKTLGEGFDNLKSKIGGAVDKLESSKAALAGVAVGMKALYDTTAAAALKLEDLNDMKEYALAGVQNSDKLGEWITSANTAFIGTQSRANMAASIKTMLGESMNADEMTSFLQSVSSAYGSNAYMRNMYSPDSMVNLIATGSMRSNAGGSNMRLGRMMKQSYYDRDAFDEFKSTLYDQIGERYSDDEEGFDKAAEVQWAQRNLQQTGSAEYKPLAGDQATRFQNMMGGVTRSLGEISSPAIGESFQFINDNIESLLEHPWGKGAAVAAMFGKSLGESLWQILTSVGPLITQYAILTTVQAANTTATGANTASLLANYPAQMAHNLSLKASSIASALALAGRTALSIATGILTGQVTLATVAQWALNAAMTANPVGLVIVAIAGLIAILYALEKKFGIITKSWNALKTALGGKVEPKIDVTESQKAAQKSTSVEPAGAQPTGMSSDTMTLDQYNSSMGLSGSADIDEDQIVPTSHTGSLIRGGGLVYVESGEEVTNAKLAKNVSTPIKRLLEYIDSSRPGGNEQPSDKVRILMADVGTIKSYLAAIRKWTVVKRLEDILKGISDTYDWILSLPDSISSAIWSFISSPIESIENAINWVWGGIQNLLNYLGIDSGSNPPLSGSALEEEFMKQLPGMLHGKDEEQYQWIVNYVTGKENEKSRLEVSAGKGVGISDPDLEMAKELYESLKKGTSKDYTESTNSEDKINNPETGEGVQGNTPTTKGVSSGTGGIKTPRQFVPPQAPATPTVPEAPKSFPASHVGSLIIGSGLVNVERGQEIPGPASLIQKANTPTRELLETISSGGSVGGSNGLTISIGDVSFSVQAPNGKIDYSSAERDLTKMVENVAKTAAHINMRVHQS